MSTQETHPTSRADFIIFMAAILAVVAICFRFAGCQEHTSVSIHKAEQIKAQCNCPIQLDNQSLPTTL